MSVWLAPSAAVLFTIAVANHVKERRKLRHVKPMSGHLPVLGRLKTSKESSSGCLHELWSQAAADADAKGVGMVKISVLGERFVVLVTPDVIAPIMKRGRWVRKWEHPYKIFHFLGTTTPTIVDEPSNSEHTRIRGEMARFFNSENIDAITKKLVQQVDTVFADLEASNAQAIKRDGCFVVKVAPLVLDIISKVAQNVMWETDTISTPALQTTLDIMDEVSSKPLKRALIGSRLHPAYWRLHRSNWRSMRNSWEELIRMSHSRPMEDDNTAFWACMRRSFPKAMTDKTQWHRAVSNAATTYFAGSETTLAGVVFMLASVAVTPDCQDKLEKELSEAGLLTCADNPHPRQLSSEDLASLPYLNAVFCEGLRYFPPAPSGTWRRLQVDIDTPQGLLPKGTVCFIPPWACHHSTQVWGKDVEEFRPERWLEARSANAAKKDAAGNTRWLPFSDGAQNCVGFHLGTLEAKMALAMFVARYRLSPSADVKARSVPELKNEMMSYITCRHRKALPLVFTPRMTVATNGNTQ